MVFAEDKEGVDDKPLVDEVGTELGKNDGWIFVGE